MSSTQTSFFDSLVTAVRENPLAAALIGGGAVWLLAGDEKLKSATRSATAAASPIVDLGARNVRAAASGLQRTAAPPTAPEMDHDDATGFGETTREAGSAASDAMSEAADKIKDRFDDGVAYARENLSMPGKEAFTKAQSSLADMLDRQPLVLGAVGLTIGAAIAGAFRASDVENEWVGELSDDIKTDLNTRASAVSQSLREASDTLSAEVGDVGAEAIDRVKQAGIDAADAAREKVKSP
ncbi:hypothetical protein [Bradyrhizobium sp. CCBAU 53421]|uniref:hypothetical protein n=1 Tax=Bradyrhizobium sp. CCBAU 53421 TaxID=1325120 RepID=UPI00188A9DD5|nr:hypothetical protein [Bradyrhizobium sp. CCBAU 53421]QOZ36170.1 hypothetical protein XH92_34525 [Bradyrhizobium sp. CCBAU 53421]